MLDYRVQGLQTVLLLCLVMLGLTGLLAGVSQSDSSVLLNGVHPDQGLSKTFVAYTRVVFAYILPLAAFLWSLSCPRKVRSRALGNRGSGTRFSTKSIFGLGTGPDYGSVDSGRESSPAAGSSSDDDSDSL